MENPRDERQRGPSAKIAGAIKEWRFFVGVFLGISVGVPVTVFCLNYLVDQITTIVVALVICLVLLSSVFAALFVFRDSLLGSVFKGAKGSVENLTVELTKTTEYVKAGNVKDASSSATSAIRELVSIYVWGRIRWRMLTWILGLVAAIAVYIQGMLIFRQNELFELQNDIVERQELILKEQNQELRAQTKVVTEQFDQAERTKLLHYLYQPSDAKFDRNQHNNTPAEFLARIRLDALKSYVSSERRHDRKIDLNESLLQELTITSLDLSYSTISSANLSTSVFKDCNLSGVDFTHSNLGDTRFSDCVLDKSVIKFCNLERTWLEACLVRDSRIRGTRVADSMFRTVDFERSVITFPLGQLVTFKGCSFANCIFETDGLSEIRPIDEAFVGCLFSKTLINEKLLKALKTSKQVAIVDGRSLPFWSVFEASEVDITSRADLKAAIEDLEYSQKFFEVNLKPGFQIRSGFSIVSE